MTKGNPKWEQFEKSVQGLLELRSTPGSGNQWHNIGDGVSLPSDPYRLMVDCKYTEQSTYSLAQKTLAQWWDKAAVLGYRVAIPVRFDGNHAFIEHRHAPRDWVTITLDDYAELVGNYRILEWPQRCGVRPLANIKSNCCRKISHSGDHDNGEIEWAG